MRWGLVPQATRRAWAPETVDRVVEARRLGESVRPLWRRAILAAKTYRISPPILRRAMIRTLTSIAAPTRKMNRISRAVRWEARKLEDPAYIGEFRRQQPLGFIDPSQWKRVLKRRDVDDRLFGETASMMAHFAHMLEIATRGTSADISSIPYEERVILLTIRQLARLAH
jgi:hypothetical protein